MDPWWMMRMYLLATTSPVSNLACWQLRTSVTRQRIQTMHDAVPAREWREIERNAIKLHRERQVARALRRR